MAEFTAVSRRRILESGELRITEDLDVRIVSAPNSGVGTLTADPTANTYSISVKNSDSWQEPLVYVRRSGTWVIPTKGYYNDSGTWKRID